MNQSFTNFTDFHHALEHDIRDVVNIDRHLTQQSILGYSTYIPSMESVDLDNPYRQYVSNEGIIDGLKTLASKIYDLLKAIWEKFLSACRTFGQLLSKFATKIRHLIGDIFAKEKVVKKAADALQNEASLLIEGKVKQDPKFKSKCEKFAEAVGKKDFLQDVNTVADLKKRMKLILDGKVNYDKVAKDGFVFAIREQDWRLFAFNKAFKPLDPKLLKYEQSLADHYLSLALKMREIFHPEVFEATVSDYAKQFSRVDAPTYYHQMGSVYRDKCKDILAAKKIEFKGPFTDRFYLMISQAKVENRNPWFTLRDELRKAIPKITDSASFKGMAYQELYLTEKEYQPYMAAIKELLADIERNRKLLTNENNDLISQGFVLNEKGLDKLIEKNKLNEKMNDRKSFGKALVSFLQDGSMTSVYYSQFCISLYSRQCALLNRQFTALNNMMVSIAG